MRSVEQIKAELAACKVELASAKTEMASKKLSANGGFGKFGSKWSTLYSPDLMIQVTITGQLALLMLIESIETAGIRVISANTDGIVIKCQKAREPELNEIIAAWEKRTNFTTEETRYKAIYSRDVNSYIAVKEKGGVKQKGAYSFTGSSGMEIEVNPSNYVCIDAVIAHLTDGTPIEDTIYSCADIRRFLSVRSVTGGAVYGREGAALSEGAYLGKVVRWYYATGVDSYCIRYRKNGNTVPLSQGCRPMMDLVEDWPDDIDYPRYVAIAKQMLIDIGHTWAPANMLKRDRKAIEALI